MVYVDIVGGTWSPSLLRTDYRVFDSGRRMSTWVIILALSLSVNLENTVLQEGGGAPQDSVLTAHQASMLHFHPPRNVPRVQKEAFLLRGAPRHLPRVGNVQKIDLSVPGTKQIAQRFVRSGKYMENMRPANSAFLELSRMNHCISSDLNHRV
jgi:hypothetical protein